MTDTINSALLAATTKSLKVLQNVQAKQDSLIEVVSTIAREQKAQGEVLSRVHDKPEPEVLSEIKNVVMDLSKTFATFDLDALERSISTSTRQTTEQSELSLISRIDQVKEEVISHSDKTSRGVVKTIRDTDSSLSGKMETLSTDVSRMHDEEIEELNDIKQSGQIETLRKLIAGLTAQRNNLDKLANYIEILSDNVQKNRKDVTASVGSLVQTVQDSNARTKSMDLRLSAVTGEVTDDSDDLAQSLALLEGFGKSDNQQEPIQQTLSLDDSGIDELNEIVNTLSEE